MNKYAEHYLAPFYKQSEYGVDPGTDVQDANIHLDNQSEEITNANIQNAAYESTRMSPEERALAEAKLARRREEAKRWDDLTTEPEGNIFSNNKLASSGVLTALIAFLAAKQGNLLND